MRILVVCLLAVTVAAEQKREAGYPYRLAHGGASQRYHHQSPSSAFYYTPRTNYHGSTGYRNLGPTYTHSHSHTHAHSHAHGLTPYHHLQKRESDPGYTGYGTPYHSGGLYAVPQGYKTSGYRSPVPYYPYTHGGIRYAYETAVHHPGHGYSYQAQQAYVADPNHHHAHHH
ncbi:histidine-rich glycoprotein-like [Eriocheir sinensis]|uniref:histidine-rich glycoprotein-like n=1 Tax=Eriocheir sinensis TaxID=95602 RepID=UPI0021CA0AAC|nr:histidine-rich glycoprotein-like [Eriocheir sinensis]